MPKKCTAPHFWGVLLFQSVLSYAKMNEVREMLKHETFKGNCTVFFTKVEHYHTKETDYVKINCN